MEDKIAKVFLIIFPFLFIGGWLLVTAVLMTMAGWFDLARRYPDKNEDALLTLRFQSGRMGSLMGGVSMGGILRLQACRTGLRVGVWKLFGPFCRDFFVPWKEIRIRQHARLFGRAVTFDFGNTGKLELSDRAANAIARHVSEIWPELRPVPEETNRQALFEIAKLWVVRTVLAGSFFTLAPRLISPEPYPSVATSIGFPAAVFGLVAIISFLRTVKG